MRRPRTSPPPEPCRSCTATTSIWQYLSEAHEGPGELSLADSRRSPRRRPRKPGSCRAAGGNELGAQVPQASRAWVKCGGAVGFAASDGGGRCAGMIRRMHARPDGGLQADIAVLSREPREVSLRAVIRKYDDSVFSDASSRQFAGHTVHAIILSDGAEGTQPPNLLLPPAEWQEGRIYEVQAKEGSRFLRCLQAVRRGEDYVRATFEWLAGAALGLATPAFPLRRPRRATFSGICAIMQSVVRISPAIEAAFCSAVRVTLQGSSTPISTRSPYSPVAAL